MEGSNSTILVENFKIAWYTFMYLSVFIESDELVALC